MDWFCHDGEGASLIELRYWPCEEGIFSALADVLRRRQQFAIATDQFSRALVVKRGEWAQSMPALPREFNKCLPRKERRLREQGGVAHLELKPGEDAAPWIAGFLALEASGWKGKRGSALACSEGNRRFALKTMSEAARRGRLLMAGIDFDGRPISRCINFTAGVGSFAFKTAFDESFAQYSPGVMAEVDNLKLFHRLAGVLWMDSLTEPDNDMMNRLWNGRRLFQTLLIGTGAWGELAASGLPLARWAQRRVAGFLRGVAAASCA